MDNVQAVEGTTMTESASAATQDIIWEEAAPGPVSPLGSGRAHNQRAVVSVEYIMMSLQCMAAYSDQQQLNSFLFPTQSMALLFNSCILFYRYSVWQWSVFMQQDALVAMCIA